MGETGEEGLLGGVGLQGVGVAELGLLAVLGAVLVDLAQDIIEKGAGLVGDAPLLEAFEGAVIGCGLEEGVAGEPFDDQVGGDLGFQLGSERLRRYLTSRARTRWGTVWVGWAPGPWLCW